MNRFPRVMGVRLGYDPDQVDELIRRIEQTLGVGSLDGPAVTADDIRSAKFAVKLGGYNETAVDFALDAFIVAVEARAGLFAAASGRDLVSSKDLTSGGDAPSRSRMPGATAEGPAAERGEHGAAMSSSHRTEVAGGLTEIGGSDMDSATQPVPPA